MGHALDGDERERNRQGFAEALGRTIKVLRADLGIERRDLAKAAPRGPHMSSGMPLGPESGLAIRPSLRDPNRDLRAALIELEHLLRMLAPEDIERLLDFARRLAR